MIYPSLFSKVWQDFSTKYCFLSMIHFESTVNLKASIISLPKMMLGLRRGKGDKESKRQPGKKLMQWYCCNFFLLFLQVWSQNPGPACTGHDLSLPQWQVPIPSEYPLYRERMWSALSARTATSASWQGLVCPQHHLLKYNFDSVIPAGKLPWLALSSKKSNF